MHTKFIQKWKRSNKKKNTFTVRIHTKIEFNTSGQKSTNLQIFNDKKSQTNLDSFFSKFVAEEYFLN